jgi:signal transduction histidine kinase
MLCMSDATAHLAKGGVDIVLLDMGLPDGHGIDTVRRAHAAAPGIPVIVLTGLDDEALAAEAMKEGAQDYLIKGQIENRALPRALRYAIERHRMQNEAATIQTHQMEFKDKFLSHVSHELRSPLTAIYQFVTILLDRLAGELNPEQHEYLEIIARNVKQLQSMINDLLEVSSLQAGKLVIQPQCVSISDTIAYAIDTLQGAATAKTISLVSDVPVKMPPVWADPTRLRQILIILLDNAIKFTPSHGTVKVQVRSPEKNRGHLLLEVSDSGSGISPDKTELIFERLFQASDPAAAGREGLGLGLYICKELVTRQGGQIWANTIPGQGAVFSVTLPVFSLSHLIAPALRNDRSPLSPVTLVVTEIGSQSGWLSDKVRAEISHWVREILQRCLNSDLDVLLPKLGPTGPVELFFILAVTDEIGGEAITRRIREKLDGSDRVREAGLTVSTSHRSLPPIKRDSDESREAFLEHMAAKIQESMNEETSLRMVAHE